MTIPDPLIRVRGQGRSSVPIPPAAVLFVGIGVGLALNLLSCPHARAQGEGELHLSEIKIAGDDEWVEVRAVFAPVRLDRYSIEILGFDGAPRPRSLFRLIDNPRGAESLLPAQLLTIDCDLDRDGGTVSLIREAGEGVPEREVIDRVDYGPLPSAQGYQAFEYFPGTRSWCPAKIWTRDAPNPPCEPLLAPQVVLNEVSTNSSVSSGCTVFAECPFQLDWVELRWTGVSQSVDLSDYLLENRGFRLEFPAGTILDGSRPYLLVFFTGPGGIGPLGLQLPPRSIVAPEFLSRVGDSLLLYRQVPERPDGFPPFDWDAVRLPAILEREIYARERGPGAPGDWDFTDVPTPGADNVIEFAGRKPRAEVIDRFPFRVRRGEAVDVYVQVIDRDRDIERVTLDWSLTPEGAPGPVISDSIEMGLDKRVYCERVEDELIYRALIPAESVSEGDIVYSVTVLDSRDNVVVTESHGVPVQASDWEDLDQFTHHIRINEISANTNPDDVGPKFDSRCHDCLGDWVELYNPLSFAVDLSHSFLTQNILNLDFRELPAHTVIGPFGYLVVCFDGLPGGASVHLPYRLDRCRDEVILIHRDGKHVIDSIGFQEEKPDRTFGRIPDGGEKLGLLFPSPCQKNIVQFSVRFTTDETSPLVINEVSADNKTILGDRDSEFGDYVEIYNRSGLPRSLDGWKLVDRNIELGISDRRPWEFPPGVTVLQGERLIVWCDNDAAETLLPADGVWGPGLVPEDDGELHTNFELNRRLDAVLLLDPEDRVADRVDFSDQLRDVAIGRSVDGGANSGLVVPSPGRPNEPAFVAGDLFRRGDTDGSGGLDISDAIALLGHLFLGTQEFRCLDAADVNDDGTLDVSDPIASLFFQFVGGVEIPPPAGQCGRDPTGDQLLPCAYPQALCEG